MNAEQKVIAEMMKNWNIIEGRVNAAFPEMDAERRYEITSAAFKKSLGI